jgi:copper chaperone CopZ
VLPGLCQGCQSRPSGIYGISNVQVFLEQGYALFDGYVSKEVIAATLEREGYHLVDIVKER